MPRCCTQVHRALPPVWTEGPYVDAYCILLVCQFALQVCAVPLSDSELDVGALFHPMGTSHQISPRLRISYKLTTHFPGHKNDIYFACKSYLAFCTHTKSSNLSKPTSAKPAAAAAAGRRTPPGNQEPRTKNFVDGCLPPPCIVGPWTRWSTGRC